MTAASGRAHGTRAKYVHERCRCTKCRSANAAHQIAANARRAARLAVDPTLAPHGSVSTYVNWGCRCPACTAVHSAACATRDRRRPA